MNKLVEVKCPSCSTQVAWTPEATFRPFCSARCRLLDLGDWFNEEHKLDERDPSNTTQWDERE